MMKHVVHSFSPAQACNTYHPLPMHLFHHVYLVDITSPDQISTMYKPIRPCMFKVYKYYGGVLPNLAEAHH